MPLRAGQLRHLLTIQTPTDSVDATGAVKSSWATLTTVWGAVWPVTAKEYIAAGQIFTNLTHRVRIRYTDSTMTTKCRVRFGDRYLDIRGIVNSEERDEMLDLMCTEEIA